MNKKIHLNPKDLSEFEYYLKVKNLKRKHVKHPTPSFQHPTYSGDSGHFYAP